MNYVVKSPHPKYPLKRYSTKVLRSWLEVAALVFALCLEDYNTHMKTSAEYSFERFSRLEDAEKSFWEIARVLLSRGVSMTYIESEMHKAKEDVSS